MSTSTQLIEQARICFIKKEFEQAENLVNAVLEIQSSNAEGLALKGVSKMQKKNWKEAAEYLEKARIANPELVMTYTNLAKTYRKLGNLKQAEAVARKAIRLNPKNDQAHLQLSGILFKTKRMKDGIREVIKAIRINPHYIKGYLLIGRLYQVSRKVDRAIQIYRRGLKFNPLSLALREELVGAYMFQGEFKNAYKRSVSIAIMRNADGDWLRVGVCAVAMGHFSKAEKAFKKTLSINPNSWEAYYNLAEIYFAAKLYQKATEHYMLAFQKDNNHFEPLNGLGKLLLMVDRNPEEAQQCFMNALELSPGQKEPMLNLALAFAASKEYDAAEKLAHATLQVAKPGDRIFEQAERLIAEMNLMRNP
jgi:tetratricopeptide (TPR) repeat protein